MRIIHHNSFLIEFEFIETLDRVSYTTSVFLIIENNKGLLIDAGYLEYAHQINIKLKKMNIEVEKIIVTHYHRDHAEGTVLFDHQEIIASHQYEANFKKCQNLLSTDKFYPKPSILVVRELQFEFYGHNIRVFETPGHTPCSISVFLDNEYLFVSDLLLEDIHSKMIIPYIDLNSNPINHLKSLRKYEILNAKHLMLTHGACKIDCNISEELIDRIFYLEKFIEQDYKPKLESCLIKSKDQYAMTEIHKLNIRNAKKVCY